MAVRANQASRASQNLVDKPDRIGPALAQVVHVDAERDIILGQAWLAAPNQLVTCGHVVEQFAADPTGLFVYFPNSGKRYPVKQVRLHPSFVRRPDGLVKFDAAVVTVQLTPPDSMALPLPFSYEQLPQTNEALWTIRYPIHLGQFSASLQPLSQQGRFLGFLSKHDSFHLLHDVPLSPGDSGSPITDGRIVIGLHCGDTATLPGLNLATTSIRLALWVDALGELGLKPTRQSYLSRSGGGMSGNAVVAGLVAFIAAAGISFAAARATFKPAPTKPPGPFAQNVFQPLDIAFNKSTKEYEEGSPINMTLKAGSDCFPFVFITNFANEVVKYFPPGDKFQLVKAGDEVIVDTLDTKDEESSPLKIGKETLSIFVLAAAARDKASADLAQGLITDAIWKDKTDPLLNIDSVTLKQKIEQFQREHPGTVVFREFKIKPIPKKKDISEKAP